jgi:hypothetical protein
LRPYAFLAAAASLYAVYYFFIQHDPERDGSKLATAYCACGSDQWATLAASADTFASSFVDRKYVRRSEAYKAWSDEVQTASTVEQACTGEAAILEKKLRDRYLSNAANLQAFDFALSARRNACPRDEEIGAGPKIAEVARLTATIKDPEPTADQIKADLIGKKMLGWNFDFLNEFQTFGVTSTSRAGDRVEYTLKMTLQGANAPDRHEAAAVAAYRLGESGWAFESIQAKTFTWDNEIPSGQWREIHLLADANYTVADDHRITVKTWSWGTEYRVGPDSPSVQWPSSSTLLVTSREGKPVTVRFTYRPRG